jgi:hypothetical protein
MTVRDPVTLRADLGEARAAALAVHATLLEQARRQYERDHGRIADAATLLTVVTSDPAFAWLRPLTATIADVDACLVDPDPGALGRARVLGVALRELLRPDAVGSVFQRRYHEAIQASPDVAVVHGKAMARLRHQVVGHA